MRSRVSLVAVTVLISFGAWGGSAIAPATIDLERIAAVEFEEPLVSTVPTSADEDAALARAIEDHRRAATDDFAAFAQFLKQHPKSGWRMSLLTNLGLAYYRDGYFSRAIDAWEQAWAAGKQATEPQARALADRAVGELARMHARLGHAPRLEVLMWELDGREVTGPATEAVQGAREGLWHMRHDPGVAYLCGPMSLKNLLLAQKADDARVAFLDNVRSGPHGVSLAEVSRLANEAKLQHRIVFRSPDQPVPIPSVVHWKVTHFAAIVEEDQDRVHVVDPTFGQDLWIPRAAVDAEASGYFLVPDGVRGPWREAKLDEVANLRGMGLTTTSDPGTTQPGDGKAHGNGGQNCGLCGYDIHTMVVSLNLTDTPVGYRPPIGPDIHITLTYNQREAGQPANFAWSNVSPKWTHNWLSYIEDDPRNSRVNVTRFVAGGGSVVYTGFDLKTNTFAHETRDASELVRTSWTPIVYERRLPGGAKEIYAKSNDAKFTPRRIFLTQVIDAQGNAVTLDYDDKLRLVSVTDATKRVTKFSYDLTDKPLQITAITDPFGRSAKLTYDDKGRLEQITDVIGMTSKFSYDEGGLVNAMTTPYGTSKFAYGQTGTTRWLEATDPLGHTERVEFRHQAPGMSITEPAAVVPKNMPFISNSNMFYRNTFYWDKHAQAVAPGDYKQARLYHWEHSALNQNVTDRELESVKQPLENRVWYSYSGQRNGLFSGGFDRPIRTGRVLDDGTTQLSQVEYNAAGRPTKWDPLESTCRHASLSIL